MSADNGIYIAEFPKDDGTKEYRVTEAQAIDNCYLFYMASRAERTELEDYYRVLYFGDCQVYQTLEEARKCAGEIEDEIENSGYPALEYGVCSLRFDRPLLNIKRQEALEKIR